MEIDQLTLNLKTLQELYFENDKIDLLVNAAYHKFLQTDAEFNSARDDILSYVLDRTNPRLDALAVNARMKRDEWVSLATQKESIVKNIQSLETTFKETLKKVTFTI